MEQKKYNDWKNRSGLSAGYLRVNNAIFKALLTGRFSGRSVYLTLDSRALSQIAEELDIGKSHAHDYCCEAIASMLNPYDVYQKIERARFLWASQNNNEPPPFIGILYLLSRAAELMAEEEELASNNYYKRLTQITGIEVNDLKRNAEDTEHFWNAFAKWLTERDYEFGRPTASSKGTWKYVGLAMSQAFIRDADRESLEDIFEAYNFTINEKLSLEEIQPYVDEWMNSSKPNARLKKAWQKRELRKRFYETVLNIYFDWSNLRSSNASSRDVSEKTINRLNLLVNFVSKFPKSSINFRLGKGEELNDSLNDLKDQQNNTFSFGNFDFGAYATLSPNPLGRSSSSLNKRIELNSKYGKFTWSHRVAIPLAKSESGPYWSEVSRVSANLEHHVLLKKKFENDPIVREFNDILSYASTGKAQLIDPLQLDGLSEDWLYYKNVVITRSDVQNVSYDLQHLIPLSSENILSVSGGLQVSRGIWHSKEAPVASIFAKEGPTRITISTEYDGPPIQEKYSYGSDCKLPLKEIGDGTFFLTGEDKKNNTFEKTVILRSADRPKPIERTKKVRLAYKDLFSASPLEDEASVFATGHLISNSIHLNSNFDDTENFYNNVNTKIPIGETENSNEIEDQVEIKSVPKINLTLDAGTALFDKRGKGLTKEAEALLKKVREMPCFVTGTCTWICESKPAKVSPSTPLKMVCGSCNKAVLTYNRGKEKRGFKLNKAQGFSIGFTQDISFTKPEKINHDLFLDSLCYLGVGKFSSIERLLAHKNLGRWEILETISSYSALGFIDLEYKPGTNRIDNWSISQPTLYPISHNSFALSGFRCDSLIEEIKKLVTTSGGTLKTKNEENQPTIYLIENLDMEAVKQILKGVKDPLNRELTVVNNFCETFTGSSIQNISKNLTLKTFSLGASPRNLQKFDVKNAKWVNTENYDETGGYRFDHHGRVYTFLSENKIAYAGPQQLIKLLAARFERIKLHFYDTNTRRFYSTLGAEPIGLLSRLLVSCSGKLPHRCNTTGNLIYENIPPKLAKLVHKFLYNDELV